MRNRAIEKIYSWRTLSFLLVYLAVMIFLVFFDLRLEESTRFVLTGFVAGTLSINIALFFWGIKGVVQRMKSVFKSIEGNMPWLILASSIFLMLNFFLSLTASLKVFAVMSIIGGIVYFVEKKYHVFFVVRKDVAFKWKLVLMIASVFLVIAGYGLLSYRMHKKNPDITTIPNLSQYRQGLKTIVSKGDAEMTLDDLDFDIPALEMPKRNRYISKVVELLDRLKGRPIVDDSIASLERFFLGLAVGLILSVILGILMGCFWWIEALFILPLTFFAAIPGTAMFAIYFAIIRTQMQLYIAMIAFGILPGIAQAVYLSVKKDIPLQYFLKARTLGLSTCEEIWEIAVKCTLPRILDALPLYIGLSMIFLIAAEMSCGGIGWGYRIRVSSKNLDMNVSYLYLICIACFVLLLKWLINFLNRKLHAWS
jgi:NitT/TauT family transport system permease protein